MFDFMDSSEAFAENPAKLIPGSVDSDVCCCFYRHKSQHFRRKDIAYCIDLSAHVCDPTALSLSVLLVVV